MAELLVREGEVAQHHRLVGPHEADRARRREQLRLQTRVGRDQARQGASRGDALPGLGDDRRHRAVLGRAHDDPLLGGVLSGLLRDHGEVTLDLALSGARAQRQLAPLGLQRDDVAQVSRPLALERDELRLDAQQLLGPGAHLGVGNEVLCLERLELRQRFLGELLALASAAPVLRPGGRARAASPRCDDRGRPSVPPPIRTAVPSCRADSADGRSGWTRPPPGCLPRGWTGRRPGRTGRRPAEPAGPRGRALPRSSQPAGRRAG